MPALGRRQLRAIARAVLVCLLPTAALYGAERDLRQTPADLNLANVAPNLTAGAAMVAVPVDRDALPELVSGSETLRGSALRLGGIDSSMRTQAFIGGVGAKGDLDDDGDLDLVVAQPCSLAPHAGLENCCAGRVMVFWAPRTLPDVPRTYFVDPIGDWTLIGGCQTTEVGTRLAIADINGDGKDDLIAGGLRGWDGFSFTDTCLYAMLGPLAPDAIVDLYSSSADVTMCGGDSFGESLAAGDLDGDGVGDVVVSGSDGLHVFRGQSLVGGASWTAPDTLVILPSASRGAPRADDLPLVVHDVDGDGKDDLLVGLAGGDGEVDLVLGRSPLPAVIDLNLAPPDLGVLGAPGMELGASLGVGRWTADRSLDLVIGAPGADGPGGLRPDAGAVVVLRGLETLRGVVDIALTPPTELIHGVDASDRLGDGRAGRGLLVDDVNGDGIDDIAAWSPGARGIANTSVTVREELSVILGAAVASADIWHSVADPAALSVIASGATSPWDAGVGVLDDGLLHFYRLESSPGPAPSIFVAKQESDRTVRLSWLDGAPTASLVDAVVSSMSVRGACARPDGRSAATLRVTPRDSAGEPLGAGLDVRPSLPDSWLPGMLTGGFRDLGDGSYEVEVAAAASGMATISVSVEGTVLAARPTISFASTAPSVLADSAPRSGPPGTVFRFSAIVTDGAAPFSYSWDLDGDGAEDSTEVAPRRQFDRPAWYDAVVTVTDADGCMGRGSVVFGVTR